MEAWHNSRGQPGLHIDGRCDWKEHGVYRIQQGQGEKVNTHVWLTDTIRRRSCHVALSKLENVSYSSLVVQTNYSDRHASIESIEK
eukprot:776817-Amphidinium_carterae.1